MMNSLSKGVFASQQSFLESSVPQSFLQQTNQKREMYFRTSLKAIYSLCNMITEKSQKVEKPGLVNQKHFIICKNEV